LLFAGRFFARSPVISDEFPAIANTDFDDLIDLVLPSVKSFSIANQLCTGEQIEKLGKIMPNLTKLHVGLGNDGFQMVCKTWKKLENLVIIPFQVEEKGILGTKVGEKCYHLPNITDLQSKLLTISFAYKKGY